MLERGKKRFASADLIDRVQIWEKEKDTKTNYLNEEMLSLLSLLQTVKKMLFCTRMHTRVSSELHKY